MHCCGFELVGVVVPTSSVLKRGDGPMGRSPASPSSCEPAFPMDWDAIARPPALSYTGMRTSRGHEVTDGHAQLVGCGHSGAILTARKSGMVELAAAKALYLGRRDVRLASGRWNS